VHLEKLPSAEEHQEDEDRQGAHQSAFLDSLQSDLLGHFWWQEIELSDRLVRLGQRKADGAGQYRSHLGRLPVRQVELGHVQAIEWRDGPHRDAHLGLEHGDEPVELGSAAGDQDL
jgi:hypothetical protein